MTTYASIPNSSIDGDSPIDAALLTLLRDNPIAIAEAAAGAPQINPRALSHQYPGWLTWFGDGAAPATINYAWNVTTGEYKYTDFTLTSGGSMTCTRNGIVIIRCSGRATIAGTITASAVAPYTSTTARYAPYAGATASGGAGGGSDAENGFDTPELSGGTTTGTAGNAGSTGSGGTFELLLLQHIGLLSLGGAPGGDSMVSGTREVGGRGGGVVIIAADEIDFTGTINCSGGAGEAGGFSNQSGAGGGGGGAIIMVTRSFIANTGTRNVSGGAGGASGGGASGYAGGYGGDGITRNIIVS